MKLGMRAHDFGRFEPSDLAKKLHEAGFETCQLALTKAISTVTAFSDINLLVLENVRRSFSDNNVEIGVLGCYVEIGHENKDSRLAEVKKFLTGLEHAKELGVRIAGTETTHFPASLDIKREPAYENLRDSVLRMVEAAEKLDVNIGIETVADHTLNSALLTRRLLDEVSSKKLKVILDPVNLILTQQDIDNQDEIFKNFLNIIGTSICALHVKDIVFNNGEKLWKNIGQGDIHYKPIFKWLQENNNDLPILREHVKPSSCETDVHAIRKLMTV
ncbi:MAG: sugar phosphate isomerase/epimerase [Defluviitaleaceae bacterium]|nr:sugar phosphate isomerase/epimerase [Defluviitaleaceae bacterium]